MKITEIEEVYFEYAFCMMDIAKSRKREYNGYKEKDFVSILMPPARSVMRCLVEIRIGH